MTEFFINSARVDVDRCRIHFSEGTDGTNCQKSGRTVSLEPKVIQVLHFLALHSGEVVSHKTLLGAIWTNTVVEPSALQRCIAQLRKAFQDDARQQKIIATYSKRGYSLVAQVRWQQQQEAPASSPALQRLFRPAPAAGFAMVLMLLGALLLYPASETVSENPAAAAPPVSATPASDTPSLLSNPSLLAAIADPDDFPVYSPDGRFVVYPRYLEERKAHLWARDLAYGNDFLLTDEAGRYEHLAWSRDGSQLIFVDATCLSQSCQNGGCTSLKSVAISQSETNALAVEKLIDCSPVRLLAPEWLNPHEFSVIELEDDHATLVRYDLKTLSRNVVYESDDMIPYHLSYSRQTSTLTIMAINRFGKKELLFLDTRTGNINRNNTAVFTPGEEWYPSSTPL